MKSSNKSESSYSLLNISVSQLFDSGVHFGHKKSRWNPKMSSYIYGVKDNIHIIDLRKTMVLLNRALQALYKVALKNGRILFVGTKVQAMNLVQEYAEKCGQYYVNHRWLGGILTNWLTVLNSLKKLENLIEFLKDETQLGDYKKKEILSMKRKRDKMMSFIGGIRNMGDMPDLLIVLDINKEHIAIKEAQIIGIPIIGIVDTNCNPDNIDYPIPGNDDAIKAISLYLSLFSDTIIAGMKDGFSSSRIDIGESSKIDTKNTSGKTTKILKKNTHFSENSKIEKLSKEEDKKKFNELVNTNK